MLEAAIKEGNRITYVAKVKDSELYKKYFRAASYLEWRGDFKIVCGGPVEATNEGHSMKFAAA
ncbi:MAG: hypothetical protein CBC09_05720 [Cellvibrionales bacterium TMED49]|nr:hypothetical protein [Porticoccaceae bacterium]OUU38272.1 MAG: hypothetical protein CBC09_05720 [Cellvibrionales bacterium TMED49]|tara:strand:+ start:2503 stop:2691 length:189 start_codon:yes stop_codon:yes gene_type:complete